MKQIIFSILLPFYLFAQPVIAQTMPDTILINAIIHGNLNTVSELVKSNADANRLAGNQNLPLVFYAMLAGKLNITEYLISQGANLNQRFENTTMLELAIKNNNDAMVKTLVELGADINLPNNKSQTPLMIAVMERQTAMVALLINLSANVNYTTPDNINALDIAIRYGYFDLKSFLITSGAIKIVKETAEFTDGPHIFITDKNNYNAVLLHASPPNKTEQVAIDVKNIAEYGNFMPDINEQNIKDYISTHHEKTYFSNAEKILAIGDVHGKFNGLTQYLISNQVIDTAYNWSWGKGHLVFMGDIFDRGTKVTQTLWLIVKLTKQAQEVGGKVHLLLGNHEVMALTGDYRYLHNNYYNLCNNLNQEYNTFFAENTLLGKYIRTRNAAVVINNNLFIHAGISATTTKFFNTIDEINSQIGNVFSSKNHSAAIQLLTEEKGPLWYRGYFAESGSKPHFSEENMDAVLQKYQIKSITVGHSEQDQIEGTYKNSLFAINIPFEEPDVEPQALYIDKTGYYRLYLNNLKVKLR